jgi:hypothetical protein
LINLVPNSVSTKIDEELARDIEEYATKPESEIDAELAAAGIDPRPTILAIAGMIGAASALWQRAAAGRGVKKPD